MTTILLSLKPSEADAVLAGGRRTVFKKQVPSRGAERAIVYASAPVKAIVGEAEVFEMTMCNPRRLWSFCFKSSVWDKSEFDEYFRSSSEACGMTLEKGRRYAEPISLPGDKFVNGFSYLSSDEIFALGVEDEGEVLISRIKNFVYAYRPADFESLVAFCSCFEPSWEAFLKSKRGDGYFQKMLSSPSYKSMNRQIGVDNRWAIRDGILVDKATEKPVDYSKNS